MSNFAIVIELEKHIEILLLKNDCVIVPRLGGFTASHIPARYDEGDNMFVPPLRTLGFNPKLNINDSLLVHSYTEAYDISYPEALARIESEVEELKQHVKNDGSYELTDIGVLSSNSSGGFDFTPCESGILTPALYSLCSFEMRRLTQNVNVVESSKKKKEEPAPAVVELETVPVKAETEIDAVLFDDDESNTVKIKLSLIRNICAVFIAAIAFFVLAEPVNNDDGTVIKSGLDNGFVANVINEGIDNIKNAKTVELQSEDIAKSSIAEDVNTKQADAKVEEKKDAAPAVNTVAKKKYGVVLASRVSMKNAENFVRLLASEGYPDASVFKEEGKGVKVIYGMYNTQAEAYNIINKMKSSAHFSNAWVYRVNG